jgi:hypothetical protein
MSRDVKAHQFEEFARMRLEGRSDVVYRAYDLLSKERNSGNIRIYLAAAGQYVPHSGPDEPLRNLQHRFMNWGHPVMTLGKIEELLHEYWVYQRIRFHGKKNWPYRDPDDSEALYQQHVEALKLAERKSA